MNARRLPAGAGWRWIACGTALYRAAPLHWLTLAAAFGAAASGFALIPVLGAVLASLLGPALAAALLIGAAETRAGRRPRPGHLLHAFADGAAFPRLLGLGAAVLALNFAVLMALLTWAAVALVPLVTGAFGYAGGGWLYGQVLAMAMLLLVVATAYLLLGCALLYAVPLVMWRSAGAWQAMRSSLRAALRNWLPWLVACLPLLAVAALLIGVVAAPTYHMVTADAARIALDPVSTDPFALLDAFPLRLVLAPLVAGFLVHTLFAPLAASVLYCSFCDVYGGADTGQEE